MHPLYRSKREIQDLHDSLDSIQKNHDDYVKKVRWRTFSLMQDIKSRYPNALKDPHIDLAYRNLLMVLNDPDQEQCIQFNITRNEEMLPGGEVCYEILPGGEVHGVGPSVIRSLNADDQIGMVVRASTPDVPVDVQSVRLQVGNTLLQQVEPKVVRDKWMPIEFNQSIQINRKAKVKISWEVHIVSPLAYIV